MNEENGVRPAFHRLIIVQQADAIQLTRDILISYSLLCSESIWFGDGYEDYNRDDKLVRGLRGCIRSRYSPTFDRL